MSSKKRFPVALLASILFNTILLLSSTKTHSQNLTPPVAKIVPHPD